MATAPARSWQQPHHKDRHLARGLIVGANHRVPPRRPPYWLVGFAPSLWYVLDSNSGQSKMEARPVWPIPQINDDNRAFWTGGRDGELKIARCGECGYYIHPPTPRCPRCLADNVRPSAVSGRGRVYTYTVNEREWSPGIAVPYVL